MDESYNAVPQKWRVRVAAPGSFTRERDYGGISIFEIVRNG
jgi:hypothetical protein